MADCSGVGRDFAGAVGQRRMRPAWSTGLLLSGGCVQHSASWRLRRAPSRGTGACRRGRRGCLTPAGAAGSCAGGSSAWAPTCGWSAPCPGWRGPSGGGAETGAGEDGAGAGGGDGAGRARTWCARKRYNRQLPPADIASLTPPWRRLPLVAHHHLLLITHQLGPAPLHIHKHAGPADVSSADFAAARADNMQSSQRETG